MPKAMEAFVGRISRNRRLASIGQTVSPFLFANVPGYPNQGSRNRWFGGVTYTKTFSPSLINQFRFTAQRNNNLQSVPATKLPTASQLGIGITPDNPTGPPNISLASGLSVGFSVQGPTNLIDRFLTAGKEAKCLMNSSCPKSASSCSNSS